jgi:hypothetical protein
VMMATESVCGGDNGVKVVSSRLLAPDPVPGGEGKMMRPKNDCISGQDGRAILLLMCS